MRLIMDKVPVALLGSSKWGGKVWKRLKEGDLATPGWDRLKQCEFWHPEGGYKAIHLQLSGRADDTRMQLTNIINSESGAVLQNELKFEIEGKNITKPIMVGRPLGVMNLCKPCAIFIECEQWVEEPQWLLMVLNTDTKIPVVLMGHPETLNMLEEIIAGTAPREGHYRRRVVVHADVDLGVGGKVDKSLNHDVHLLLVTPSRTVPPYRTYVTVKTLGLAAEVVLYLVYLLGLGTVTHLRNLMYIPRAGRPTEEVTKLVGGLTGRCLNFAVHIGVLQSIGDTSTFIAGLSSSVTSSLREYGPEHQVLVTMLKAGDPISVSVLKQAVRDEEANKQRDADKAREQQEKKEKQEKDKQDKQERKEKEKDTAGGKKRTGESPSQPSPAGSTKATSSAAATTEPKPKAPRKGKKDKEPEDDPRQLTITQLAKASKEAQKGKTRETAEDIDESQRSVTSSRKRKGSEDPERGSRRSTRSKPAADPEALPEVDVNALPGL